MVSGFGNILYELAEKTGVPKRMVNNFTKRQRIGRNTLVSYIERFERLSRVNGIDISDGLAKLRLLADEDVVWDEIREIEYVKLDDEKVYDFSVEGLETFTTSEAIVTHNTMRTFHYAGVAEHVPTGLPRLIEIVDAKKEPKKPIIDIYLKSAYARSRPEAEKVAKELASVFVSDVADVEDDLESLTIRVAFNEKDGKAQGVTFSMLKKALEAFPADVKSDDTSITLKPLKESKTPPPKGGDKEKKEKKMTAKAVRKLTQKVRDAIVRGVLGIHKAVVLKGQDEYFIRAGGFNLIGACQNAAVDHKRIYTNNIKEVERVYGIEAARNAIVREIKDVMDMQRLFVDIRHIMLIADAVTYGGMVKSIGRHGLSGEKVGVLGRAAFEETIKHLINASAFAEEEKLIGVTENIIVGQTVPVGTGKIKLVMKTKRK
jgi:DNA-directed RNA polymerase subunit A"